MSSTLLVSIVAVVGTVGFMVFMRRKLNRQYSHMRAGEVAPRLGMQLTEGNPEHNLVTMSVQPSVQNTSSASGLLRQVAAGQVGGTLGEFKLRMVGQPYGANAELVLYCRQDFAPGITSNVTTTWHDCRLTVHARCQVAPFELRLRDEHPGLEARRTEHAVALPAQQFGDAALDRRYVIEASDARATRYLGGALGSFGHAAYVHIVGSGNQISFVMTPASVNASAMTLEQTLHALVSIAAAFEGRPAPGALLAQPIAVAHA